MKRWLSILLILLMTYLSTSVLAMADDSEQHRISCLKIEDTRQVAAIIPVSSTPTAAGM